MSSRPHDQTVHDKVNLFRLVKRLDESISEENWSDDIPRNTWIKSQTTLQKIKHARVLLKNIQADEGDTTSATEERYQGVRSTLDRLENVVVEVNKRVTPQPKRPRPLLPTIPRPTVQNTGTSSETASLEATLLPAEEHPLSTAVAELPSSTSTSEPVKAIPTAIHSIPSPSATVSASKATATAAFLQNSRQLQDELSEQLAQMATQLKRNAMYFSESLSKDKAVMEEMDEKVQGNFDIMKQERIRLRDFRGKGGSTTCLAMMSVLAVLLAFFVMVFIIRATR